MSSNDEMQKNSRSFEAGVMCTSYEIALFCLQNVNYKLSPLC